MGSTASNNLILDISACMKNDYYSIITWAAEITWQLPVIENYPAVVGQSETGIKFECIIISVIIPGFARGNVEY
jgi:hypothetical protein